MLYELTIFQKIRKNLILFLASVNFPNDLQKYPNPDVKLNNILDLCITSYSCPPARSNVF